MRKIVYVGALEDMELMVEQSQNEEWEEIVNRDDEVLKSIARLVDQDQEEAWEEMDVWDDEVLQDPWEEELEFSDMVNFLLEQLG